MDPKGYNYYNTNFGNHICRLKMFLKWLEDEKGVAVNRSYKKHKILEEEIEIIFLTAEELELTWEHRDSVKPEFVKYIDLCMFGNLTGLRYSDIKRSIWRRENGFLCGFDSGPRYGYKY